MKKMICLLIIGIFAGLALHAQDSLRQYVAKYKFPEGSVVTEIEVVLENGALSFNSNLGSTPVEKTGVDEFSIPAYNGSAVFTRNDANKITGLKIDAQGVLLEGTIVETKPTEIPKNEDIHFSPKSVLLPQVPYQNVDY